MSNLAENVSGAEPEIILDNNSAGLPIAIYQQLYNQITGRTEKISQKFSDNLLIDFSQIEQLNHKIMQMCDVHHVIASNQTVSIFYKKERKEQFTSFDRFKIYNSSSTQPTLRLIIRYDFSIKSPHSNKAQEYTVTINLTSRVSLIKEMEDDAPSFLQHRLINLFTPEVAEISVEYVDYVIARGFLEAFNEWVVGCKSEPKNKYINFFKKHSHYFPNIFRLIMSLLFLTFILSAIPDYFKVSVDPNIWARFIAIFSIGFYLNIILSAGAGRLIEHKIDSISELSYINLNKGDEKLIEDFKTRRSSIIKKIFLIIIIPIVLSIISSKLERFI